MYTPTGAYLGSEGSVTQTVDDATTTTVSSSNNPSALGQSVTFTALVTNTSTGDTPAGAVEFFDGTTDLGPGTPSAAGNAATSTLTISTLSLGDHTIQAVYTASGDFLSGSGTLTQAVDAATSTAVVSNRDPSDVGQSVTFTVTVTNTSGSGGTPTGAVEFLDGSTYLGAGSALTGGGNDATSTLAISTLSFGSHAIRAVYEPSGNFFGGSGSLTQTVDAVTTTAVASNHNPAALGQPVTFTATVTNTSGSGGTPTGAVEFFDSTADLGPGIALGGGGNTATSTLTISTLALGNHAIEAVYTPTGDFTNSEGARRRRWTPRPALASPPATTRPTPANR